MKQQLWFPYTLNHCTNLRNLEKTTLAVKGGQGGELTPPNWDRHQRTNLRNLKKTTLAVKGGQRGESTPILGSMPVHQLEEFEKNNPGCERRPGRRIDPHIGIMVKTPKPI
jgi:hypothetical protein